jgi:hypothetical protein
LHIIAVFISCHLGPVIPTSAHIEEGKSTSGFLKAKSYVLSLPGRVLVELPRPTALRKRLMHFPFEIIIWDTKVF